MSAIRACRSLPNKSITAKLLGNPPPRQPDDDAQSNLTDAITVAVTSYDSGEPPPRGSTVFTINHDKTLYDSGSTVEVSYNWNEEIWACEENESLLDQESLSLYVFRDQILPRLQKLLPVMGVRIRTLQDLTLSVETYELRSTFPAIPSTICLPRVPISQLRRVKELAASVDMVTIEGRGSNDYYAFKHQVSIATTTDDDRLLKELEFYVHSGFESKFLMLPTCAITDSTGTLFRGFLTPFLPAGTLSMVFRDLHPDECNELPLFPIGSPSSANQSSPQVLNGAPKLAWHIRYTWAIEVVTAVVTLHGRAHCGDIKLCNILLDRLGHCQLIDYAPIIGCTDKYLPPEGFEYDENFLPPEGFVPKFAQSTRDIFALGLVLWQIGSEVSDFSRDSVEPPVLVWRRTGDRPGTEVPTWFRDVVVRCLTKDAEQRPSAADLLLLLTEKT
ncbi:hypothetical protein H0H93_004417 [Arthromyces matolae]|nr:hypothetical protein H0H93_004417 [Arthromyces matolae]